MKILYISNSSGWAGSCSALVNLLSIISKVHEIYVFLPSPRGELCNKLDEMGIQYMMSKRPYSDTIYPYERNPLKYIYRYILNYFRLNSARKSFKRYADQIQPDIIHCNVGPLDLSFSYCKKRNIPHVWHLREYQDLDFNMKFFPTRNCFLKKIHSLGNYNIAITKGIFKYWELRPNIDRVIYDGVFPSKAMVNKERYNKREKFFLFVGRVSEAKGPHHIINVFSKVLEKYPDYVLKIAGEIFPNSDYYSRLITAIKQYGLQRYVQFLGMRNDVCELMSKATALIVPSRFEGFGFITAEAMYNDCLVIGNNTAGTKEQFDIGLSDIGHEIGLRFENEEELLRCMIFSIENDTTNYIASAKKVVMSRYTKEKASAQVLDYYNDIIAEHLHTTNFV